MCGIVGVITKHKNGFTRSDMNLFQQALIADSLRGTDSTGLFSVHNSGEVAFAKVASHPFRLLQTKETEEIITKAVYKGKAMVGHNRKATVGNINNENAHPFIEDHIILVHNGSVSNADDLAKENKLDVEVDSHVIAHILATEKDVAEALKKLKGSFAIAWYNQIDHTLNLIRNSDRPLHVVEVGSTIFFASEKEMVEWLLKRNHMYNVVIKELPPNELVTYNLKSTEKTVTKAGFKEHNYGGGWSGGHSNHANFSGASSDTTSGSSAEGAQSTPSIFRHGQRVAFKVLAVEPKETPVGYKRHLISGETLEGKHIVRYWMRESEKVEQFIGEEKLMGIVGTCVYRGGSLAVIWLDAVGQVPAQSLEEPEALSVKTYNGTLFSASEWKRFVATVKCRSCDGPIPAQWAKYTSIKVGNQVNPEGSAVCPDCMAEKFPKWTEKEQKTVIEAVGYSPLDYLKEKTAVVGSETRQ